MRVSYVHETDMEASSSGTHSLGHLHSQAKEIVYNVNRYFIAEKANRGSLMDVNKVAARTAAATKLSESTVGRICSKLNQACKRSAPEEPPVTPTFNSPKKRSRSSPVTDFDQFDKDVLRRTVLNFYARKEIPTLCKIKEQLLKDGIVFDGCLTSLRKVLLKIGFKFTKVDGRKFLMERSDIVASRAEFLREIKKYREQGANIVYLDETWINQNYSVQKCWTDCSSNVATGVKPPIGRGNRLIILHAGTENGFVPHADLVFQAKNDGSDYHSQMNAQVFERWFTEQLLPNIAPSSIIVMDNASYHSVRLEKYPTASWKKAEIFDWLVKKGANPNSTFLKAELLEMAKNLSSNLGKRYSIDAIASEAGHKVIRLPPYHCQYNPIELIWANIKTFVSHRNQFKMSELQTLTHEAIRSITPKNWSDVVRHAHKIQDDDAKLDVAIDHFVDSLVIQITESSDDELSS